MALDGTVRRRFPGELFFQQLVSEISAGSLDRAMAMLDDEPATVQIIVRAIAGPPSGIW